LSAQADPRHWTTLSALYHHLISGGNHYPLVLETDRYQVHRELERFTNDWKIYNPAKPNFRRFGLSLTSLDGGLSGEKDLTSLRELNRQLGTSYDEMAFRKLTPVYECCPSIRPLVDPFLPFLGRSHFLRFGVGGFFPYHRDSFAPEADTFRIFVPLHLGSARDFIFLLGNERLNLEPGRAYFINTRKEHALFSLEENSVHLVLNVELNKECVEAVGRLAFSV
jgi:hypothetical protein